MIEKPTTIGDRLAFGGAVVMLVAAFLPWASVDATFVDASVTGIDSSGLFTFVFGLLALGLVPLALGGKYTTIATALIGGLSLLFSVAVYLDLEAMYASHGQGSAAVTVSPEIGLYLTIVSSLLVLAGSVLSYRAAGSDPEAAVV